jgi:hypothetical protein
VRTEVETSIDVKLQTVGNMTVMADVRPNSIRYTIEGGGTGYNKRQAEEIGNAILSCVRKARRLYSRSFGRKAP